MKLTGLTHNDYIKISEEVYFWCVNTLGTPLKSGIVPFLYLDFENLEKSTNFGQYWKRNITIYPYNMRSFKDIITTIIHEYAHFLQMPKKTDMKLYYNIHDYVNHPMEIEAVEFEKKYYKKCYYYLRKRKII